MIADLNRYAEMKDSGVEWLGSVPKHWKVVPNRTLFGEVNDRGHESEEMLSVTIARGVIFQESLLTDTSKKDSSNVDKSAYKLVRPMDIAYNKMRAWQGAIGKSDLRGIVSPAYVVMRPRSGTNSRFIHYLYRTPEFAKEAERWSYGITSDMWSLRPEHFKMIYGCLPPAEEQAGIARFLDYADRRIQRYIRAKEKLIALLEEQKQVIVHQAVTGQIDVRTGNPYPAYKDSGVEWLGAVPSHWDVLRLGKLIALTVGFPFKSEEFTQSDEDIRLLRGINIAPGQLRWDDVVRWPVCDVRSYEEFRLSVGDIILGMDRPIIRCGVRVAVVSEPDVPSLLLQRVARIRPIEEKLTHEFAMRLFSGISFSDYLTPIFTGVSVPHLSPEQIRGFRVALPSLAEQEAIEKYLRSIADRITRAVNHARTQISHMHELRTRLISDAVTGKFDTREAMPMPETEVDDIEDCSEGGPRTNGRRAPDDLGLTLAEAEA